MAWGRLTRLLTLGKDRAEKGDCILGLPDLLEEASGLNLIVMPPPRVRRRGAGHSACAVSRRHLPAVPCGLPPACFIGATIAAGWQRLRDIADSAFVPLIAVNDVLYHAPERRALQDVVTCIREHRTLEEAGRFLELNAERHLKSADEMTRLFGAGIQGQSGRRRVFLNAADFHWMNSSLIIPANFARVMQRPTTRSLL